MLRALSCAVASIRTKVDLLSLSRSLPLTEKGKFDSAFRRARNAGISVELYKRRRQCKVPEVGGEVLYGTHPVLETLKSGRRTVSCVYSRDPVLMNPVIRELCAQNNIPVRQVGARILDNLSEYQLHNGVCADVSPLEIERFSLDAVPKRGAVAFLFLDGVLDSGNVGAIVRSTAFFGGSGVIWTSRGPQRLTPSMSKASSGALEHFPVFSVESFGELHRILKPLCFSFVGTIDEESAMRKGGLTTTSLSEAEVSPKSVFIMGDEQKGVSQETLELCDLHVSISRSSSSAVASLNVSVASGLLLHHWASRQ
ncbi:hypothetical protein QR680_012962 [Steinernema hermaphroditum]|uniref:rRNA methyltransferase 1, mitochondrial n=1 Tax=Steinernema hermaphroditum TaxID=289476 RepID=A0AA39I6G8_9BILA|nr:hypothetical protein QR680_012962 [Steinernema hermaphroditum]